MVIRLLDSSPKPKPIFKFLNAWGAHADFLPLIRRVWDVPVRGNCLFQVMQKLRKLKWVLREFHNSHFAGLDGRLLAVREAMIQFQKQFRIGCTDNQKRIMEKATADYKELILAEELILKQKLKNDWLMLMDRCTPYFYATLKSRQRRGRIKRLLTENGREVTEAKAIGVEFIDYFKRLLGDDSLPLETIDQEVIAQGNLLTIDQQRRLVCPFTAFDVRKALGDIKEGKSPGVDGFNSFFFKCSWEIVGRDITDAILEFFASGRILKEINATVIHLIPKHVHAARASEFRPIACCTTLYKIIAKMLC
ncbi:hypothetical protein Dimus_039523 [Dionaea muscipula]